MSKFLEYKNDFLKVMFFSLKKDNDFRFFHLAFKYYKNYNYSFIKNYFLLANINLNNIDYSNEEIISSSFYNYCNTVEDDNFDNVVLFVFDMYAKIMNTIIDTINPETKRVDRANNRLRKEVIEFNGKYNQQMYHLTTFFKKIKLLPNEFEMKKNEKSLKFYFLNKDIKNV